MIEFLLLILESCYAREGPAATPRDSEESPLKRGSGILSEWNGYALASRA
jgi:hypothetical protein